MEYGKYGRKEGKQEGNWVVSSVELADGTSLERFAQSIQDELRRGLRSRLTPDLDESLVEINSFERTQVGGEDAYSIAYRFRTNEYCSRIPQVEIHLGNAPRSATRPTRT